ncbi:MAG: tetratricopeptide repeat protein [Bacteroidetes bacterium]|jgi:tetratricopeptide (TPR) repeat protein|nr:tetratricopeptide repeat protein [Bacteroidota bacterium]
MNLLKLLFAALLICQGCASFGQNKLLQKANRLYKADQFSEAAKLFEEALKEKNNLATRTKLAYCYRMNNRLDTAEVLYAQIVQNDKAKARTYFYYGETLMGNGKYDEAKKWFQKYIRLEPEDEKGSMMVEACERVKLIRPYFPDVRVWEFPQNSEADDSNPVFFGNSVVFSSDRNPGIKLMKRKSGWTGRDYINLFVSEYYNDTLFSEPKSFSAKLNQMFKNTGNPAFSKDENTIFFSQNGSEESRKGIFNMQLYTAKSNGTDKWKSPEKLPFCSTQYNYMHPSISPDGKWLFFVSDKPGGEGGADIWYSEKTKNGWGKIQNLGKQINTPSHEGFPFFDNQGRLFFCSKGHAGFGGFDIFVTKRTANDEWGKPVNLGLPINSSFDDISIFLSKNNRNGAFTSSRSGGDDDIFLFEILDGKTSMK